MHFWWNVGLGVYIYENGWEGIFLREKVFVDIY